MSRHAAATSAGRSRTGQRTAPAAPRRVSGPAAPNRRDDERQAAPPRPPRARIDASALAYADAAVAPRRTFTAPQPRRLAYGGAAIASRVAGVAVDVSASRLMDRLVRGRVWIAIVAFCLIGLVAMQVSLLKLNSGIGRAVQTASTLERSNSALRGEISRLSAGDRIQRLAAARGMVMPAPADVTYLRGRGDPGDAARAARRMRAADPNVAPGLAGAATPTAAPVAGAGSGQAADPTTATPATASVGAAPAGTNPAGTTPAGSGPAGSTPAGTPAGTTAAGTTAAGTTAPGTTPAATAPAATAPAVTQPVAAGTPGQAAAPSGGASPQATTQTP
jgi:cell division protein FtsL